MLTQQSPPDTVIVWLRPAACNSDRRRRSRAANRWKRLAVVFDSRGREKRERKK